MMVVGISGFGDGVSGFIDLTSIEEQKKCFHYTNLQPLWAKDNLIKSNKILQEN